MQSRPSTQRIWLQWLQRHVSTHTGIAPNTCPLAGCGRAFQTPLALAKHVEAHFASNHHPAASAVSYAMPASAQTDAAAAAPHSRPVATAHQRPAPP